MPLGMEPGTLVLVRGVLGILELLWGMGYLLGAQADVPPLEGLVFPVLKGDPLSFGFQRVVFPRAMQLGKTAGAAGAPEQGEPGLAEVGGWSRPLMGKGPRRGSCHQGWQDLRGQAVCRLRELPGKREAKAWPGLCPLPGTRPTLRPAGPDLHHLHLLHGLHLRLHGCRAAGVLHHTSLPLPLCHPVLPAL